ncbi:MAG: hypothetical protein GTO08_08685 [Deltaproteobacteria bacterium]|nr:hypothetical protein [Deltaproteobacteria bacterium]
MGNPATNDAERKVLRALYHFYKEFGPGATPNLKGLDAESGIMKHELEAAVRSLTAKGLIEYWELGPAVRLTEEGLLLMLNTEKGSEEKD